uniref:D-isomer specific 2-hydroxyacid dehydrogenase catalytic domain-containing protein n=1 Tax=Anas zonorhyncha TaxID=75864 RepID=A0A8B9ZU02_9AVES
MLRRKAFNLLKAIHLMAGQPNLAYKGIHPVIASHGHRPHRSVAYRQRYKTGAGSAGGRTLSAPQTKAMSEQELPGLLILDIGGTYGVQENIVALLKKHFCLITMKEFLENKKEMSKKIQSVFVFECRPTVDQELLESLPNLKVIGNSGVGVDHLNLKMISNFGVKVTNTPHAVADSTADIGMALMLASARRLVEGNILNLPGSYVFLWHISHSYVTDDLSESILGMPLQEKNFLRTLFSEASSFLMSHFFLRQ